MTWCFGVRSPGITRFHGAPFTANKSRGFTDAAQSLIKTSLSAGVGVDIWANCSTSGDPYCVRTIAFIPVIVESASAALPTLLQPTASEVNGKYKDKSNVSAHLTGL